jgi:hypothetical protein
MALMGLLIAFKFGTAEGRFNARRFFAVDEANAISRSYLRIQALDEGPSAALSSLMIEYPRSRANLFQAGDVGQAAAQLQRRIWSETIAAVRANPAATTNPSLLQAVNEMFDLAASRRAAFDARVPISILRALLLFACISAAMMGYGSALARRQIIASTGLFLAITVAICQILDLDRLSPGTITISQAPITRAIASIDAMESAKLARLSVARVLDPTQLALPRPWLANPSGAGQWAIKLTPIRSRCLESARARSRGSW